MSGEHDNIVLSEWELETLAAIRENLGDSGPPLLERRHRRPPAPSRRRLLWATLLFTVGFGIVVGTFTSSLWPALAGLAVMVGGAVLAAGPLVAAVRGGVEGLRGHEPPHGPPRAAS